MSRLHLQQGTLPLSCDLVTWAFYDSQALDPRETLHLPMLKRDTSETLPRKTSTFGYRLEAGANHDHSWYTSISNYIDLVTV